MKDCSFCNKKKTEIICDACEQATCKKCSYFIDEDTVEFLSLLPERLVHKTFCPECFHGQVGTEVEKFNAILDLAQNIDVFDKKQTKETRLMKRSEKPLLVNECDDRNETLMRLAFLAAQKGFNTLLDVDISSKRISAGGSRTKQLWSGRGIPFQSY